MTAIAQVQPLTTTAQQLLQHIQPFSASAISHVLQPISLQLTGWQHACIPGQPLQLSKTFEGLFSASLGLSLVSACVTTG
jgi:hypothetical protein